MKPVVQDTIKHQVNDTLFPRRDVKRSLLSIEIVFEANGRPELEPRMGECIVNRI